MYYLLMAKSNVSMNRLKTSKFGWFFLFASGCVCSSKPFHFYAGLGGGYNSLAMTQQLYAYGENQSFNTNGSLTSYGHAGGYSNELPNNINTFSPQAQLGIGRYLGKSRFFLGCKAVYQYLNARAVTNDFPISQSGNFVDVASGVPSNNFSGNVVVESSQLNTNHQFNFFAVFGYSFSFWHAYLAAGPSIFAMQSKINHALPFADLDGVRTTESNYAISYSNTMWVWGGGAQLGMRYQFSQNWFLDFNYSAIGTGNNTINNPKQPIIKTTNTGKTTIGTLFINPTQSLMFQTFAITINRQLNV
jgi:hypothetical protein